MDLKRLMIAWALDEIPGELLPDIAWDMLETGLDSPSLWALAKLANPSITEAGLLFEAAINELGFTPLSADEALLERAKDIAACIAEGGINPFEGAYKIWQIRHEHGGPEVLDPLVKIVAEELNEIDALAHRESSIGIDKLRAQRWDIDRRYAGLIMSEARQLVQ